jgi:glycosyltransferase involved in cell wall biosynthesis
LKILHVCPRYTPHIGGNEEHVRNICERLAEKHEVEVYTTDPSKSLPEHETINHVKVTRFPSWAPGEAYFFSSKLKKELKVVSSDFEIVHAHNYGGFPALYAAQAKSANIFFFTPHYHGGGHTFLRSLLHRPYKLWGKTIFARAEKVICVSKFEMDLITRNFENVKEKLVLVPNGLNFEEFEHLKKKKGENKQILSISRLERYKGMQFIIEALPKLSEDTILNVVGKGPYREALINKAKKLDVCERVRFYDYLPRSELLQKYADADVFVLLSQHEAFGLTVAEAICAGTACIVANKSALTEWVDNERCFGIDYPVQIDKLAKLIEKIIDEKIVVKNKGILSWKDIVLKLEALYENSLA